MAFADSKTANCKCLSRQQIFRQQIPRQQTENQNHLFLEKNGRFSRIKSYNFNKISSKIQEYCLKPAFKLLKTVINIKPEEPHKI